MNQKFDPQSLIKYLKKEELARNEITIEDIQTEIEQIENLILNESFEFSIKNNDDYYFLESLAQKLLLRKLNDNIKRIYKDEQANRKFIIQQVKTLLGETAPFWIIKTDIKSFYESIDRNRIFRKLKNDAMLSYYSIFLLRKIFENADIDKPGLPRGLNISSSLSEIYMRNFDRAIQRYKGVYYYARFVDDIIIFLNNKESALKLYEKDIKYIISNEELNLEINDNKTELIDGTKFKILEKGYRRRPINNNIEYLGYGFYLNENEPKREKKLQITIAKNKVKKIKTRLIKSYLDFTRTRNFDLLIKRMRFLTGNYGINKYNDGSILKAGIYYNYSHINDSNVLNELNKFHRKIIYSKKGSLGVRLDQKLTNSQRDALKKYCFIAGFYNKTFSSFTYEEMGQIIKVW